MKKIYKIWLYYSIQKSQTKYIPAWIQNEWEIRDIRLRSAVISKNVLNAFTETNVSLLTVAGNFVT